MVKGEGFKRPEGPTSTLPRGMDNLIKEYFDSHRAAHTLPPEVSGIIEGELVEQDTIDRWRYWRTGLMFYDTDGSRLLGALDECVIESNVYVPVDYKTRGYALKENSTSYYIFQMSCYNFLLHKNGHEVSDYAYLVFYIPHTIEATGTVNFSVTVKKVKTFSHDKVYGIFRDAIEILALPEAPPPESKCNFCSWVGKVATQHGRQLKLF